MKRFFRIRAFAAISAVIGLGLGTLLYTACPTVDDDSNKNLSPETHETPASRNPGDFHIYLCFGQSNMEGNAPIEDQDRESVSSRFRILSAIDAPDFNRYKDRWYTAYPPLTRSNTGLTPADYFGRTLTASLPENIRVGVINVSVAGCKIELFDKDGYQTYINTPVESWMTDIIALYDGNPYGRLVELAKIAQNSGVIKGILLHQGESNTGDSNWPQKVKKIYNDLLADLDIEPDSIPLLVGELLYADQGGACASMNTIIAQLPNVIPNAHVISSAGCAGKDQYHFTAAGYRLLGERYAAQILSLLGVTPAE
jgi:hypothetical protein